MGNFLTLLGSLLQAGLMPMGRGLKTIGRLLRWGIHFVLLAIVLGGLLWLNQYPPFSTMIGRQVWAMRIWLPLLALTLYALAWMGWWLYTLIFAEPEASHFPDIDQAWEEAVQALAGAGIRLTDLPMFLVLGKPEAAEEHLFNAAQLNLAVKQTPANPRAPIHVYANRDAIYVTCPGAGLLSQQATILAMEDFGAPDMAMPGGEYDNFDPSASLGATLRPGEKEKEIRRNLVAITGTATARQRRAMRREAGLKLPDLLKNHADVEIGTARLAHFCRLLVRDRHPFCPINGLLVLVPLGASDTDTEVHATAECTQRDLTTLRRVLKVACPVFSLICDLETLPGFREFLQTQDQRDRLRRLGQRFPFLPDLHEDQYLDKVRDSVGWLGDRVIPQWIYKLFRLEMPDRDDWASVTTKNSQLFLMQEELRDRAMRMGRVISHGVARPTGGMYAGCYLAGTGAAKDSEQGFIAGVFRRLTENQNFVSWTDQALADDTRDHRITNVGYGVLALMVIGIVATALYVIINRR